MPSLDDEIDRNYDAFTMALSSLLPAREGQHALLRHAEIIGFYASVSLALAEGRARFADGVYSVQEVTGRPVDLGFYSHAVHPRLA